MRWGSFAIAVVFVAGLAGCFGNGEPSESQMKDALDNVINHPPGVTGPGDPVKIVSFKKGACDKPTGQGVSCTFAVTVTSNNPFAQMYNNVSAGVFYKDSGKWMMRSPF
jgi:hypothetical protein